MRKTLTALAAAATLAAALATPTTADARRGWWGPGLAGGFIAGAIVGGALARPYYYGPGPVYYYAPGPVQYEYYDEPRYYREAVPYDDCWRVRRDGVRYRVC